LRKARRALPATLREASYDGKILSLYARGMTPRDIQAQLQDLYGVNVLLGKLANWNWAFPVGRQKGDAIDVALVLCGISRPTVPET
jgi:hypothetical protein